MNYLAHFYLSFENEDLILGNLAGDVVKGDDWKNFPPGIAKGILLHREIDFFTDTHPTTFLLKKQIVPFAGRFSGPVSDIVRDHFLSVCWPEFSEKSIPEFSDNIYGVLSRRWPELPEKLHDRTQKMVEHRWLTTYQTLEGLAFVLEKFQIRLAPHRLEIPGLIGFLKKEKPVLLESFRGFFGELIRHCENFLTDKNSIKPE